jgi:hypothetical protein
MPSIETACRFQKALLWESDGFDDFGNYKVKAVEEITVRWEDVNKEALDAQGNTIAIDAVVVVNRQIPVGSIMWKGALSDLAGTSYLPSGGFLQVILAGDIPDIKARHFRRVLSLMRYSDALPTIA